MSRESALGADGSSRDAGRRQRESQKREAQQQNHTSCMEPAGTRAPSA